MSLLIAWDGTANCYAASVLNTDTYYLFAPGYDPWFLAQYMTWDSRDVLVELFGRNAFFDTGLDGGAVFDSLYSACDTILLAEYWTWSAPGGSVLADVLVDAGEALLAGLGAFKAKLSPPKAKLESSESKLTHRFFDAIRKRADAGLPDGPQVAASDPDFQIAFINEINKNPVAFTLSSWYWPNDTLGRLITGPGNTMAAHGTEQLSWLENASDAGLGEYSGQCTWYNGSNSFGVRIYVPTQVWHMGYSPYYQICWSNGKSSTQWTKPVSDPGQPYTFPVGANGLPWKIRVSPKAGGTSLLLTVMISDPDPAFANGVSEAKVTESNGVTGGQKVQQPSHKMGEVNHRGK